MNMENPKNEDIKKTGEKTAEVLEETVEEVGKEKVEKAEGFRDQFEGNDKEIEESLNGNNSPEAEGIRSKEKDVMNKAGEKISGFKNEVENIGDKEKAEREKLLKEVFENSVGGIMTSFHDTGQVYKTYGEKIGYKKGFIINQFPVEDKEFKQNGINEAVTISPVSTEVYGEKEFTKGTFFKKKEKIQVETGMRDMNFDEIKEGGGKERAYRFVYKTIDDEKSIFRDQINGRGGQYTFAELYMPESKALEVLKEIKSKPKFARELVEKLVKDEMNQDQWNGGKDNDGRDRAPLRPPYEEWTKNKKGESKMYIQEPDVKERGLNKDWIVDVEKGKSQEEAEPKPAEQKTEAKEKQPDKIDKEKAKKPEEREKAIDPDEQIKVISDWLIETEKCTDTAQLKLNLKVIEEELAIARNANIDTSQIANLEERIEKIKEAIDFEKKEEEEKERLKSEFETPNQTEESSTELFEKSGELNLSNDDLRFFIDELKVRGLENSEIFSFAKNELQKREKEGIDFEPIKQLPEKKKEADGISKEYIEEHFKYSDKELVSHIKFGIEMAEKNIKKESITATSWIESIEEEIEEAKKRNIDLSLIDKFEKSFQDIKEKVYLAEVMGNLNIAESYATEYKNSSNKKLKEIAAFWIYEARNKENEHKKKINKFDLEAIDKKIKEICAIVGFNESDITREEFQKSEEDRQRLLAIDKEIMGKMRLRENVSSPKETGVEPEPKSDEPKPEPKLEPKPEMETPEPEKTAEEVENEKLADKIIKEVNEKKFDDETRERLGGWDGKSEEEKKEEINITVEGGIDKKTKKEKAGIKEKLGDRLMEREKEKAEEIERAKERGEAVETKEGARLINQESVKEILKNRDELKKLRDEIGKEAKSGIEERKIIAREIKAGIDPNNLELAKLNIGEKMMAKEAVSGFLRITKDILSLSKIDYLLEAREINFGDLPKTHEKRKIEMEELQETIDAIEEYKKFMERFEIMTEEKKEEAREELGRFVRWLNWVKENKKDLFLVLVAIGVIAGVAVLASSFGLPSMSVPAYLTAENAIKAAVGLAAVGAIGYTVKKKKVQAVLKTAAIATGLPILGAAFIANSILDSKKIDGWMEWATGTKMMFGAGSKEKK